MTVSRLLEKSREERIAILLKGTAQQRTELRYNWRAWARPEQLAPGTPRSSNERDDWDKWLFLGGRGSGKTRSGAEFVHENVDNGSRNIALIGSTASDVRDVMVFGPAGILATGRPWNKPTPVLSRRRVEWANGAVAMLFSADEPDRLRGPQHDLAWCLIAGTSVKVVDGETPIEELQLGDLVITRRGPRQIIAASARSASVGKVVFNDGRFLVGTAEHPVLLSHGVWTPLSELQRGDRVCAMPVSTGEAGVGIGTKADITSIEGREVLIAQIGTAYTEQFGSHYTGLFRPGLTFITGTRIAATTIRSILSSWTTVATKAFTFLKIQFRERIGTASQLLNKAALTVEPWFCASTLPAAPRSVRNANIAGPTRGALKTVKVASIVADNSGRVSAEKGDFVVSVAQTWVPVGEAEVFNLSVEGEHEYYANGILTHNCDECAAWRYGREAYEMLMLGLRMGTRPRCFFSTTPKPVEILIGTGENGRMLGLLNDPRCAVTHGSSYENRANLADQFFAYIVKQYEGTRLGRQELEAEIIEDLGGLWSRATIEQCRVREAPALSRIVIAIDPAVTSGDESDETGIVVAGRSLSGDGYILADKSGRYAPLEWARRAIECYKQYSADRIVAEVNNGGDMVEATIRMVDPNVPFTAVRASRGKVVRAEPVAALYEQGRVRHVGAFPVLEDQMASFTTDFSREAAGYSPDRVDALVWAISELLVEQVPYEGLIMHYQREAEKAKTANAGA